MKTHTKRRSPFRHFDRLHVSLAQSEGPLLRRVSELRHDDPTLDIISAASLGRSGEARTAEFERGIAGAAGRRRGCPSR